MTVPWLSWIPAAGRWLWQKIRGRPTVQADRGAVAAGRDQTVKDSVITSEQAVRGEMGALVAASQHFHAPVVIINAPQYFDGLPHARRAGLRHAFEEGQRLEAAGDRVAAIRQYEGAFAHAEEAPQRCALHINIGMNFGMLGRDGEAQGHFLQGLELARSTAEANAEAVALLGLAILDFAREDWDTAERRAKEALSIFRRVPAEPGVAFAMFMLSVVHSHQGRLKDAERSSLAALAVFRATGDALGEARALNQAADVCIRRGHYSKALQLSRRAYALSDQLAYQEGRAAALGNLGRTHLLHHELDQADKALREALGLYGELGRPTSEGKMRVALAIGLLERHDLSAAEDEICRARDLLSQEGEETSARELDGVLQSLRALQRRRVSTTPKPKPKRARKKPPPKKP
jgi:tetratricopeptide (TPR) repeat protein